MNAGPTAGADRIRVAERDRLIMPITRWNRRKMKCFPDGEPMAVARPADAERAFELVMEAEQSPESKNPVWASSIWGALEKQLDAECGPYTFIGYLARVKGDGSDAAILDEKGKPIDTMQKGDSIIRASEWNNEDSKGTG